MKKFIQYYKKTWEFVKKEKLKLFSFLILSILLGLISLFIPILSAKVIVNLTSNNLHDLLIISLVIFAVQICTNVVRFFSSIIIEKVYRNVLTEIQVRMGREILKLNNKSLIENGSGVFNRRINSDTEIISDLTPALINNIMDILTNIGIFVAIFIINKIVCLYLIVFTVLSYIIDNIRTNKRTKNLNLKRLEQEKVSSFSSELCRGAKDIKMLSSESSFIKKYRTKIESVNDSTFHQILVDRKFSFLNATIFNINDFGFIILICNLLFRNELSIPMALVLYNYKDRIGLIIYSFNSILEYIKEYNLSAQRVFDIIDGNNFTKEKFGKKIVDNLKGDIEFRNVKFGYNDALVLKDLSFKIDSGKTVSIVGKSGVGKTTIFNLLCKFYDVDDNMIFLDGNDINLLSRESIRDNMTIISQDPYIFNMSIRENFELVKDDVSLDKIKEVCKIACLDDFIDSLKDKYDTVIGEGGINLSGGQKQRLAIARALLQETKIILFDEATSSLDNETQRKIQEAISNMKGNYTIIIIAHRFSTVINSDEIFYIEGGFLAAKGTHKELLKESKVYKELYNAEFIN